MTICYTRTYTYFVETNHLDEFYEIENPEELKPEEVTELLNLLTNSELTDLSTECNYYTETTTI